MSNNTNNTAAATPTYANNQVRLGGAWARAGTSGQFFSILLDTPSLEALNKLPLDDRGNLRLCLFPVKEKKTEKSPDYTLVGYLEQGATKPVAPAAKPQAKVAVKSVAKAAPVESVDDDDGVL